MTLTKTSKENPMTETNYQRELTPEELKAMADAEEARIAAEQAYAEAQAKEMERRQEFEELCVTSAMEISRCIGTPDWETKVSDITSLVIQKAANAEEVLGFVSGTLAFDGEMVSNYFVQNANIAEIIYLMLSTAVIDPAELLMQYIAMHDEEKHEDVNLLIHQVFESVSSIDIISLTEFGLEVGNDYLLVAMAKNYPMIAMGYYDSFGDIIHRIANMGTWCDLAAIFTTLPGMIDEYDDEYNIRDRLAEVPEEQKDDIEKFVRNIFVSYDMDTATHLRYMHILNNPWVNECFAKCSSEAFNMFGEESEGDNLVQAAADALQAELDAANIYEVDPRES